MSKTAPDETSTSLPTGQDPKAMETDAILKTAIEAAQPARLRATLKDLCKALPDAHKITAALLLATQQKYKRKIWEGKIIYDEDEDSEDEENDSEEHELDSGGEENSELSTDDSERDMNDKAASSETDSGEGNDSTEGKEHANSTSSRQNHC